MTDCRAGRRLIKLGICISHSCSFPCDVTNDLEKDEKDERDERRGLIDLKRMPGRRWHASGSSSSVYPSVRLSVCGTLL